jgi:membrane protein YdbS with pleckstrin-like domain
MALAGVMWAVAESLGYYLASIAYGVLRPCCYAGPPLPMVGAVALVIPAAGFVGTICLAASAIRYRHARTALEISALSLVLGLLVIGYFAFSVPI